MKEYISRQRQSSLIGGGGEKSLAPALLKILITFGLVFNLSFVSMPLLSTGRIAVLVLMAVYAKSAITFFSQFSRRHQNFILILFLLLPFTMIWQAINGSDDAVMFSRVFWFLIFSVLGSILYISMCKFQLSSAMQFYLATTLLQAIFVFYSVLNPDFREWVEVALINAGNIDFADGVRFSGLSNGGGAALSVQLSLGVVSSLVLFIKSNNSLEKLFLIIAALFITFSVIFVGRTGLYISLIVMIGFIFLSGRALFFPIILIAVTFFVSSYIQTVVSDGVVIEGNEVKLDRTASWAFDIFLFGKSTSAMDLASEFSNIREITITNLLIGSGRVSELDGSNYSGHDSGYLHTLYAVGLPITFLFYISLFLVFCNILRPVHGKLKVIGIALVLLVFALEIKEPFIFKYTLPFFMFVYALSTNLLFMKHYK